jgi:hypothetical protein
MVKPETCLRWKTMREDERRWMKSYIIESKFLSSLRLQSKGALAIPTLQSWRRLDGKWCGKMQYSDRTSWTFIVHRAKNLNLTRINVFFAFWYGLCIIEKASSIHDIYIIWLIWHNMTMQERANRSLKGLSIDVYCKKDSWHFMAPARLRRLAKMKHPTIWLLNYAPVAPCWKR